MKKTTKISLTRRIGPSAVELNPISAQVDDEFTLSWAALIEASVGLLAANGFQGLKVKASSVMIMILNFVNRAPLYRVRQVVVT